MNDKIEHNKKIILNALASIEAKSVVVRYSGCGDSGQIEDVVVEPVALSQALKVSVLEEKSVWNETTKKWEPSTHSKEKDLEEAIKDLCYDLLSKTHSGWENNDGGDGEFTFDIQSGKIKLNHREFYQEVNETDTEF